MSRRRMMGGGIKQEYTVTFDGLREAKLFVNDYSNFVGEVKNYTITWKAKPYTAPVQFLLSGDGSTWWVSGRMTSDTGPLTVGYNGAGTQTMWALLNETVSVSTMPYKLTMGRGYKSWSRNYGGFKSPTVDLNVNPVQLVECRYTDSDISYTAYATMQYTLRMKSVTPSNAAWYMASDNRTVYLSDYGRMTQVIINSDSFTPEWRTIINKV